MLHKCYNKTLSLPGKDITQVTSYRPISLLSVCFKLLQRLILRRIAPTVDAALSPDQAGFRQGRSTCDQVTALATFIENGFQEGLKTRAVFLDLTAAYDTVWHTVKISWSRSAKSFPDGQLTWWLYSYKTVGFESTWEIKLAPGGNS